MTETESELILVTYASLFGKDATFNAQALYNQITTNRTCMARLTGMIQNNRLTRVELASKNTIPMLLNLSSETIACFETVFMPLIKRHPFFQQHDIGIEFDSDDVAVYATKARAFLDGQWCDVYSLETVQRMYFQNCPPWGALIGTDASLSYDFDPDQCRFVVKCTWTPEDLPDRFHAPFAKEYTGSDVELFLDRWTGLVLAQRKQVRLYYSIASRS